MDKIEKDTIIFEIMQKIDGRLFDNMVKRVNFENLEKEITTNIVNKINSQISPEILTNFNVLYQESTNLLNILQENVWKIEKKAKKCVDSTALYEDVYKIRDEMKIIKKKLDKLNRGFKSFGKLSEWIEDNEDSK